MFKLLLLFLLLASVQATNATELPTEIWEKIKLHLHPKSVARCSKTCKKLSSIFKSKLCVNTGDFLSQFAPHGRDGRYFDEFNQAVYRKFLDCGYAVNWCCENGLLELLQCLHQSMPDAVIEEIESPRYGDYYMFINAAASGHVDIMKQICLWVPSKRQEMIKANSYEAFRIASRHGHCKVLHQLKEWGPVEKMIQANDFEAPMLACRRNDSKVFNLILSWMPSCQY